MGVQRAKPFGKCRGHKANPASPQPSPKQTNPKMRGCQKNGERSKAMILIKCADPNSPAFPIACPLNVSKTRKERSDFAANKHPNKGDSPCQFTQAV